MFSLNKNPFHLGKNDFILKTNLKVFQANLLNFVKNLIKTLGGRGKHSENLRHLNFIFIKPRFHKQNSYFMDEIKLANYISLAYSIFINHFPQTILLTQDSQDFWVHECYKNLFFKMIRKEKDYQESERKKFNSKSTFISIMKSHKSAEAVAENSVKNSEAENTTSHASETTIPESVVGKMIEKIDQQTQASPKMITLEKPRLTFERIAIEKNNKYYDRKKLEAMQEQEKKIKQEKRQAKIKAKQLANQQKEREIQEKIRKIQEQIQMNQVSKVPEKIQNIGQPTPFVGIAGVPPKIKQMADRQESMLNEVKASNITGSKPVAALKPSKQDMIENLQNILLDLQKTTEEIEVSESSTSEVEVTDSLG